MKYERYEMNEYIENKFIYFFFQYLINKKNGKFFNSPAYSCINDFFCIVITRIGFI